jgi:hypothetical protein
MEGTRKALLVLVAVGITLGVLWYDNRVIPPKEATWDNVRTEAKQGGYRLISTDELWKHYTEKPKSLLLVDTRQEWEYRSGHIKGALNFPIEPTWLLRWAIRNGTSKAYLLIVLRPGSLK